MNRKLVFAVLSIVCLAGTLVSATLSVGVSDQPAYMVVRGSDNGIYYRLYNEGIGTWGAWTKLPGVTCDSPSAAYIEEQLCVVVRGMDGSSMWQGFVNVNTGDFSGWTYLSGSTPSAVELGSASSPSGFGSSGYVSLNAVGFSSVTDGAWIDTTLMNKGSDTCAFCGAVQLPHGATITNVTWYWYDADTGVDMSFQLRRGSPTNSWANAADGTSSGSAGWGSTTDTTIAPAIIDSIGHSYYFVVYIPVNTPTSHLRYVFGTVGYAYPT
jgi:hypothetical protein